MYSWPPFWALSLGLDCQRLTDGTQKTVIRVGVDCMPIPAKSSETRNSTALDNSIGEANEWHVFPRHGLVLSIMVRRLTAESECAIPMRIPPQLTRPRLVEELPELRKVVSGRGRYKCVFYIEGAHIHLRGVADQ